MKKQFICIFIVMLALFSGCAEVPAPDYVGVRINGTYNLQLEVIRPLGITHEGMIRVEAWASRNVMIKEINLELLADGCTQLKSTELIKVAKVTSQYGYTGSWLSEVNAGGIVTLQPTKELKLTQRERVVVSIYFSRINRSVPHRCTPSFVLNTVHNTAVLLSDQKIKLQSSELVVGDKHMAVDLVGDVTVHPQGQVSAPKVWGDGFKLLKAFRLCHGTNGSSPAIFSKLAWSYDGYYPEQLRLIAFGGVKPEILVKSNTSAAADVRARVVFSSERSFQINPGACQLFGLYYPPSVESGVQFTIWSSGVTVQGGYPGSPVTTRLGSGSSILDVRTIIR